MPRQPPGKPPVVGRRPAAGPAEVSPEPVRFELWQRLRSTLIQAAPEAQRALQERALQLADVRAAVDRATIDLGRTVRTSDTLYYAVDTDLKGENVRLIVVGLRDFDRDSTATLWRIEQRQ